MLETFFKIGIALSELLEEVSDDHRLFRFETEEIAVAAVGFDLDGEVLEIDEGSVIFLKVGELLEQNFVVFFQGFSMVRSFAVIRQAESLFQH